LEKVNCFQPDMVLAKDSLPMLRMVWLANARPVYPPHGDKAKPICEI